MDANARLLAVGTDCVGDLGEEKEDKNSPYFQEFIESLQLFAPATFTSYHWGPIATWVHPNGRSTARLDYVLFPLGWKAADIWTSNVEGFHSGQPGHDHTCTMAVLQWSLEDYMCASKRASIDREAMLTPEGREVIAQILQEAPEEAWTTNASEHAANIAAFLRAKLIQAFPNRKSLRTCKTAGYKARENYQHLTTCKRRLRQVKQMYTHILLKGPF